MDAWTDSSRSRCRMSWLSWRYPSAVWMKEMPFCEFCTAMRRPRICDLIFSDTARPDASSPARLIRMPDESFSMSLSEAILLNFRLRSVNMALML